MAGGDGSARRRTAKSVEAAAMAPQAPLRSCSTKRKARKEAASGRMPRPRASGKKDTASASASACTGAEQSAGAKNRLPAKDIRWILSQKPEAPPARFQALKRSNPELVPRPGEEEDKQLMAFYGVTRALYEVQERMPKLQEWVRSELKEKGYVEVDDDWFKSIAEAQAKTERDWPRIRAKLDELSLMDGPHRSEYVESDSDEEDGEDDLESVMKDYM